MVRYSVQSYRDLANAIIPHFYKFPLLTKKKADYLLFKEVIYLLNKGVQSDIEGIHKILSFKASMNKGLSDELKFKFPTVIGVPRTEVNFKYILNEKPFWLTGFVDGEGCFYVKITKARTVTGYQISLSFSISQHIRDELLLTRLIDNLGCGKIEKVTTRPNAITFVVYKFSDINNKIIPFFKKYPLQGIKSMDYNDFCKIAKIMEDKSHLTPKGLKRIKSLKSGLNKGRIL